MPTSNSTSINQKKNIFQSLGFRLKISLPFCIILILVFLALWLLIEQQLESAIQSQNQNLGNIIVVQSADSLTELVITNDLLSLNVILNRLVLMDGVTHAVLYDVDNRVISSAGDSINTYNSMTFSAPIDLQDSIAGRLELQISNQALEEQKSRLLIIFWGMLIAGLMFMVAAAMAISSHILPPLIHLTKILKNSNNNENLTDLERNDEIGQLTSETYELISNFESLQKELFGDKRKQLKKSDTAINSQTQSALLCIDVANFKATQAMLNPLSLSKLLDTYFHILYRAEKLYSGQLFHFTGQSIILGFTDTDFKHALSNSLECAYLFNQLVKKINHKNKSQSTPTLDFNILLHSGEVVQVHSNRQKDSSPRTMIGPCINEAQNMLSILSPDHIVSSSVTFNQLTQYELLKNTGQEKIILENTEKTTLYKLTLSSEERTNQLEINCQNILSKI